MYIITIGIIKGGATKTTTSVGLATALARRGKRTLVVDACAQGQIAKHLGVGCEGKPLLEDILGQKGRSIREIIAPSQQENLFVAPSGRGLEQVVTELSVRSNRDTFLARALREVERDFDICIIDTPPARGFLTTNAVYAGRHIIVPTELDSFCLDGFDPLFDLVDELRDAYEGRQWNIMGVVINKYDARLKTQNRSNRDALEGAYGKDLIFGTEIRTDQNIRRAQDEGASVFQYNAKARVAEDYVTFADEVLARLAA